MVIISMVVYVINSTTERKKKVSIITMIIPFVLLSSKVSLSLSNYRPLTKLTYTSHSQTESLSAEDDHTFSTLLLACYHSLHDVCVCVCDGPAHVLIAKTLNTYITPTSL